MTAFIMFAVCLLASCVGAVAGYGGGVIIKPVLDALHILPVSTISFLSGCTVLCMSAASLLRTRGNGVKLRVATTAPLAVGAAAGGLLGRWLFELVKAGANEAILGTVQSLVLLITTVLVFFLSSERHRSVPVCRGDAGGGVCLSGHWGRAAEHGPAVFLLRHGSKGSR